MMIFRREELYLLINNNYAIILVALFLGFLTPFLIKKLTKSSDAIPGWLGFPLIGETFSLLSAANSYKGCYDFVRCRRLRYGKWFKTRLFGKIHVFVPSVVGAKTIFSNEFRLFDKCLVKSMADAVGKKSLLCVPVESHKRIRRLLSGPFSTDSLSKFVHKFDKLVSERFKKLAENGKSFVVLDFTMKIQFDAMCDMLMSITDESLLNEIEKDCTAVSDSMLSFPAMIPGSRYYKGIKARERLMSFFEKTVASRRNSNEAHEDFLQSMLERDSFPADEKLDDSEIMDNILTLILGGQSTTAAAMMWSVKFLDDNKHAQNMLREEQLSILENKPEEAFLCLEDLNKMSYGSKVVKETLRMSNVLLWFPRVVLADCKIQEFEIKKGWHVNIDATHIHYDPELYKDPLHFNPSRFDEIQKPYSYIPFGSGPRVCLGINMAKLTMLVFLHRLTSGYNWTVDDQDLSLEKKSPFPRLKSGVPITLTSLKDEI
ncbi:abscisic acid 8'-hydroxylase 1-like [Cynara cardunculus var. scolymus]|uniref:abscisic acid 8'-hydroxylase 1-like n=1 Tax=Cynara cardunculus var. scolymus TaxID=59895 RepID=UPI000D62F82F|nr:abscisic acid 8'-hydroxylase 1-like [Cynara cardunculus var. scolymus]